MDSMDRHAQGITKARSSNEIDAQDTLLFDGKFHIKGAANNRPRLNGDMVRATVHMKSEFHSDGPKLSVMLNATESGGTYLSPSEYYNLNGHVSVSDFRGNQQFNYSPDNIKQYLYTRSTVTPGVTRMLGSGTIRRVRLLPNPSNKGTGRTDFDSIELIVGHTTDKFVTREFHVRYVIHTPTVPVDDAVRLEPGYRVRLAGFLVGFDTKRARYSIQDL
ncbi:hypothetical protein PtB15_15B194 [Puccinia triticina]|nr:hypothetical protein PtB15_15B194 [Puccinia triticina]